MQELDTLSRLKNSIMELKQKRGMITEDVARQRGELNQIQVQILELQRKQMVARSKVEDSQRKMETYNKLIEKSETTLQRLIRNSQTVELSISQFLRDQNLKQMN